MDTSKTLNENIQAAIDFILSKWRGLPPAIDHDDLRQEIWLAIWPVVQDGRFDATNPKAFNYLCTMARNELLGIVKRERRRIAMEVQDTVGIPVAGTLTPSPVREIEHREIISSMSSHLSSLSPDEQALVRYRYMDGLSTREIGKIVGITRQAVDVRLKKIYRKLGQLIGILTTMF